MYTYGRVEQPQVLVPVIQELETSAAQAQRPDDSILTHYDKKSDEWVVIDNYDYCDYYFIYNPKSKQWSVVDMNGNESVISHREVMDLASEFYN